MPDVIRTQAYLIGSEAQDGQPSGAYTLQDIRDFMVSVAANTCTNSRTLTAGTTLLSTDRFIFSNQSAAVTYVLYGSPVLNQMITIKDVAGNCSAFNITIVGAIDDASLVVLKNNYASIDLIFSGALWNIV